LLLVTIADLAECREHEGKRNHFLSLNMCKQYVIGKDHAIGCQQKGALAL